MSINTRIPAAAAAAVLATGAGAAGAAVVTPPPTAPPGATVLDSFPELAAAQAVRLASYGGWMAWSRPASGGYRLILRDPTGRIADAGVAPRAEPFDVNLGPKAGGGVAAVYSRCRRVATNTGCRVVELGLVGAAPAEQVLEPPGGGSLHHPALSGRRLAFLRVRPGGGRRQPDDLVEWVLGARRAAVQRLPHTRFTAAQLQADPGLRATQGATGRITWLSLTGNRVAYTRVTDNPFSDVWIESSGGPPLLADREGTGGAASGLRTYLNPVIAGQWLYVFRQYFDLGSTFVRYSLVRRAAEQAVLPGLRGENTVESAVRSGSGVAWSSSPELAAGESGSTLVALRPQVTWKAIRRPRPHHVSPGF